MQNDEKVRQVLGAVLGLDPATIAPDASMDTLAKWDSLRHMNLILALEEEFHISIPDEDAANLTSLPLLQLVVAELARAI